MFFPAHTGSISCIETPHTAKNGLTFFHIEGSLLTVVIISQFEDVFLSERL